jgi:SPP1 family predicted phage head-tail adaptor
MGIQAGRLRERLTFRRLTDTPDGMGGFDRAWSTLAENIPAEVISQNGREAVIASALQGISAYRILIRKRAGLSTGDQILFGDLELNIRSIAPDPRFPHEALQIFADTESPQEAAL